MHEFLEPWVEESNVQDGWREEFELLGKALDLSRLTAQELETLKPLLLLLEVPH